MKSLLGKGIWRSDGRQDYHLPSSSEPPIFARSALDMAEGVYKCPFTCTCIISFSYPDRIVRNAYIVD